MKRKTLVVAALLLINLDGIAAAADSPEHTSKRAQRVIATLNSLGINDPDVANFVGDVDSRVDHGYLNLSQQKAMGGSISLRYKLGNLPSPRQVDLMYAPDDSHLQATAGTSGVMLGYHLEF
jgi:hypothetical protein